MQNTVSKFLAARLLLPALASVVAAPTAFADVQYYTIDDIKLTGIFGDVTGGGSFTEGSSQTSSISVSDLYSYTFTGPLDGPGYTEKSQFPPTPCITLGCSPGETFPSTYATLDVSFFGSTGTVPVSFEDNGEIFTGTGVISGGGVVAPGVPELSTWAMLLLGFGGLGVLGYRRTLKSSASVAGA